MTPAVISDSALSAALRRRVGPVGSVSEGASVANNFLLHSSVRQSDSHAASRLLGTTGSQAAHEQRRIRR